MLIPVENISLDVIPGWCDHFPVSKHTTHQHSCTESFYIVLLISSQIDKKIHNRIPKSLYERDIRSLE